MALVGSECNNVAVLQQYTVLILAGMHVHHDQLYIVSCMAGVAGVMSMHKIETKQLAINDAPIFTEFDALFDIITADWSEIYMTFSLE